MIAKEEPSLDRGGKALYRAFSISLFQQKAK
jgi:hypothetical protein